MAGTLHKLTAGSGYDYLTRQVARQDATEVGHSGLANYYAKGEAPGVWVGSGLAGIDGLAAGDVVTAEQMTRLFGTGEHPLGDAFGDLGRVYPVYHGRDDVSDFRIEVARRCQELNRSLRLPTDAPVDVQDRARIRTQVAHEMFRDRYGRDPLNQREVAGFIARESRPRTTAVAGYDLTFSPVKSVSTLWAVADLALSEQIEKAHQDAVSDALRFIEDHALFTRTGKAGVAQVDVTGLVGAAFTHRDSRAGDPDLHTHVAVANKVQTLDGQWLAIDGRVLYKAMVTASETYNTALEKHLAPLGIRFTERATEPGQDVRKRPIREVVGVDPTLNQRWSSRRVSIEARRRELAAQFQADHHRPPTQVESIQLAQQATLETRDAKHEPRSLAEQRATWRVQAEEVLGGPGGIEKMVSRARAGMVPNNREQVQANRAWRALTAGEIVDRVSSSRSTWQVWHLRAEAQRRVRHTDVPTDKVDALVEALTQAAVEWSVAIRGARADQIREPKVLRRQDGVSVYTVAGSQQFTSTAVLDAERRIVEAAGRADGRQVAREDVDLALVESIANGVKLNAGQATLVRQMATSGVRVQLAIAPAGSGKTSAMRALTKAWESSGGSVLGLAPSAAAAAALRENAETSTDTLAKLTHSLGEQEQARPGWVRNIGKDTLVVIDEAGMADTLTLDRAISYVLDQGASVRLIGDDQQLAAIGAGGVLRDIRATHGSLHLTELMRFADAAEGAASLALREGQVESLGFYLDQRRVHVGDMSTMTGAVFDAWSADRGKGKDSIMLAPTRELVSELNQRARAHRLDGADDTGPGATLADGNRASIGDTVISRMNKRSLRLSPTDWVKNGDRWTVLDVDDEGALLVQHTRNKRTISLPAVYVAEAVELGYASTVHSAQGVSVDSMHGLASGEESRQQLYTMMTRGRYANHLYLEVVGDGDEHNTLTPDAVHPLTATDLLESILARDEAPTSATTMLREADEPAPLLAEATARYIDSLYTAAAQIAGTERLARLDETAEDLVPGLTDCPAWPTLRAHLCLVAAGGHSPFQALHQAATAREVDTAADPAAVIGWRLDDSGLRNAGPGPLPWVPGVPAALSEHSTWSPYLAERAARIGALADDVTAQTCRGAASGVLPSWVPQGQEAPSPDLLGKVAVWRAANGVAEDDHRPTGPQVLDVAPANYQRLLRSQLAGGTTPASAEWLPLLHGLSPTITADTFAPVLSERLAALNRAGIDAAGLTRAAAEQSPLPDDHAAGALWWRIRGQLAPAVAAQVTGDITINSDWTPTLATHLGADRVTDLQASPWWPALVTSIDNALGRGWALEDLASTAPARDVVTVDPAAAMTWQIAILTDPPAHTEDSDGYEAGPAAEDLAWATGTPIPQSIQATDAEWEDHLETTLSEPRPVTEQVSSDPGEVSAALALSAMVRPHLGQLEPSTADLDRFYDRHMDAVESPVPLTRLAQVNQAALDFYTDQLARGGWARDYLADRFGQDVAGNRHVRPGYAPAGWTRLVDHLRGLGYTNTDLSVSGLATTTTDGRLIDRFRDRAVFPITSPTGQVLGFIGRRDPKHHDDTPHAGPKYLNTPTTPLFAKGDQLYGADPHLLATGATPVLVEGPMDAHAVTLATRGAYIGLSPLGTALTEAQAAQLAGVGGPVIIATDADLAGRIGAERAHWLLAQHNVPTFTTNLPQGADPSSLLTAHGPSALLDQLLAASPLADTLLAERLANLPPDQALPAAATVLATAHPSAWESGAATIAQATCTNEDTTRSHLLRAVRDWHDDPRPVVADQLVAMRDIRTRLEHEQARNQAPELKWSTIATDIDPRLPREPDWPALATVMQQLHEQGHDVETAARETVRHDPLGRQPAQDLRYRLIVINPSKQAAHRPAAVTGQASKRLRPEGRDPAVRVRGTHVPRR